MREMSCSRKLVTHQSIVAFFHAKQQAMMVGKSKSETIVLSRLSTTAHVTAMQLTVC